MKRGTLRLEVARTQTERERGLMGCTSLPADGGMLFVMPSSTREAFWNVETLLPLDVAFLDAAGRVLEMQSLPSIQESRTIVRAVPRQAYCLALEVNRGWFHAHGVQIGDRVAPAM